MLKCKFGLLIRIYKWKIVKICCRSPRGNVDWNLQVKPSIRIWLSRSPRGNVDWNILHPSAQNGSLRRSPRGNVDWNMRISKWRLMPIVVPHAGTWIEMSFEFCDILSCKVAPHAGTWIEINIQKEYNNTVRRSFPTRERGLKSLNKIEYLEARGRSPRGNVDWNSPEVHKKRKRTSHSPRGNVDWN